MRFFYDWKPTATPPPTMTAHEQHLESRIEVPLNVWPGPATTAAITTETTARLAAPGQRVIIVDTAIDAAALADAGRLVTWIVTSRRAVDAAATELRGVAPAGPLPTDATARAPNGAGRPPREPPRALAADHRPRSPGRKADSLDRSGRDPRSPRPFHGDRRDRTGRPPALGYR